MWELLTLLIISIWEVIRATFRFFVPKLKKSVTGEVVLITGAAQGIGRELALIYAAEGATVVCVDVNESANHETLKMVNSLQKVKGHAYTCDISDYQNVVRLCKIIEEEVGKVTILVNNAGVLFAKRFWEWSTSEIESTVRINLLGNFWTVKAILPSMIKNNYGHIVGVSSMASFASLLNIAPYSATKCGVKGFMDGLRNELAAIDDCKIKCTTIYPYVVNTQMRDMCKIKYASLMPAVNRKEAARIIVSAQRRDVDNVTIPPYYCFIPALIHFLPVRVIQLCLSYFDVVFEQD